MDESLTLSSDSFDDRTEETADSSQEEESEEQPFQDPLCQHLLFSLLAIVLVSSLSSSNSFLQLFVLGSAIGGLIVTVTRDPPPPKLPQPWKEMAEIVYTYQEPAQEFMPYGT